MRFGDDFLQKFKNLGSHWGTIGDPLASLLHDFGVLFSESDFRWVLNMLFGGAGGRGGLPGTLRFFRFCRIRFFVCITPCSPFGGAANLKASPLPPAPF